MEHGWFSPVKIESVRDAKWQQLNITLKKGGINDTNPKHQEKLRYKSTKSQYQYTQ